MAIERSKAAMTTTRAQRQKQARMSDWTPSLQAIVDATGCDCAIIRREGSVAQNLVLEAYLEGPQWPHHAKSGFRIPDSKPLRYWGANPFDSCFVQQYPEGCLSALSKREQEELSAPERDFLAAVRWRCSFPVGRPGDLPRLAILISFEDSAPKWLDSPSVTLAWIAGQLSLRAPGKSQLKTSTEIFARLAAHLAILTYIADPANVLAALLRVLLSESGIGWQQAWIMRRDGRSYGCVSCLGGLSLAEHKDASLSQGAEGDLTAQIATAIVEKQLVPQLPKQFNARDKVRLSQSVLAQAKGKNKTGNRIHFIPFADSDLASHWDNAIEQFAEVRGAAYEPTDNVFFCPFEFQGEEYLAVLANWVAGRHARKEPLIETGIAIAVVCEALKSDMSNGSRPFATRLCTTLANCGIDAVTEQSFEAAKATSSRLFYERSEQCRTEVAAQITQIWREMGLGAD